MSVKSSEGFIVKVLRQIGLFCLGLLCATAGQAQVSGAEPATSGEMCRLMRISTAVRIICHQAKAGMLLDDARPVRLWLPDLAEPGTRDYFVEPALLGLGVEDYVFARLRKALEYCAQNEDCRSVGQELRAVAAKGCVEPPDVYQPMSVFNFNGEELPMFPSGYAFLCRNADRMLMIWLGPMSMTLRVGGEPGGTDMDVFNIAVFPVPG